MGKAMATADEMNMEQEVLNAFERGKAFGFAEGMRSRQAEIEELKAKLKLHEAMDSQCASLMQQFRKAQEK
jgi:flagellar biosynthesis/type III secretory pathway protein FliH